MNRRFNASNDFESNHFFNATFKSIDYDYQILAAKRMFSEKLLLFMENDLFKTVEERIGKQHHHLVKIESNVLEFSHPAYGEYYAAKFLFEYVGRASISFCTPEILEDLKDQQNVRNFFFGMINSIPNVANKRNAETTTENNNQLKLLQDLGQEVLFWSCEKDFVNVLKHLRKKYKYKMIKCQNRSLLSVAKSNKAIKIQNYLTKELKCNPETDETNSEAIIPNVEPSTSSSSQRQTNSRQKSAATQKRKSGKITDYFIEKVPKEEKDIHEFWNRYKVLMDNQFSEKMFTNFWKELCQFKDSQISSLDLEEKLGSKKIISDYLSTEQSLLHEAVLSSSFEVCKFFVSNVESLVLTDNDGNTALHLAVKQMNAAIVRLLVDGGANLIATDESGNTPLDLITSKHSSDILLCLLEKMDTFEDYRFKDSLIFHAASFGCLESVKILITSGINGNSEDSEKNTALHFAAQEGHKNIVEYLLNKGSEINLENHKGKTPLMLAIENGHHEIVRSLKEHSVNHDLDLLQTLLKESVMKNQENVLKSLIEVGVDVNFQDGKTGKTLLHLHLVQNNTFPNPNIIKLLIKAGAIVEQFDNEGNSPLHHASKFEAIFPLLINHCCKINRCNSNKETPLHLALEAKKSFAARLLLFKQACIHLTDTNGNTALHVALKNNLQDVANILINLDANVNSQNSKGETPLHLAAMSGNLATARRLIENEAYVTAKTKEGKTVPDYVEKGKMSANVRRLLIKLIETKMSTKIITMHEL
ncbi:serine/threonine-protein phosphatase 6 regulatory ankyrin repeat subunit B-like isoform X1 [Culex quinquefasciatus]|uniref:serine/threonine-protein phosphatase 6 regulatory ankyrin repeat subunit B-like isoform X1 n=1 Tax=Culex quinquefasciatus TaxID=7176 RepID=UPI0018E36EC0|nr:serine/threonine-protein phosphatase 6 regulatory ankyrin repeat subunit B-like isoform X1 [Culex quinquefasciatus]